MRAIPDMAKPVCNWTCIKCKHAITKKSFVFSKTDIKNLKWTISVAWKCWMQVNPSTCNKGLEGEYFMYKEWQWEFNRQELTVILIARYCSFCTFERGIYFTSIKKLYAEYHNRLVTRENWKYILLGNSVLYVLNFRHAIWVANTWVMHHAVFL